MAWRKPHRFRSRRPCAGSIADFALLHSLGYPGTPRLRKLLGDFIHGLPAILSQLDVLHAEGKKEVLQDELLRIRGAAAVCGLTALGAALDAWRAACKSSPPANIQAARQLGEAVRLTSSWWDSQAEILDQAALQGDRGELY